MENNTVYCIKCGTKGSSPFCSKCGHPLKVKAVQTQPMPEPVKEQEPAVAPKQADPLKQPLPEIKPLEQPVKNHGVGKGCLISFLLLIGVFVIGSIVAGYFFSAFFRSFTDQMTGGIVYMVGDLF